jgi:hypothetical protein
MTTTPHPYGPRVTPPPPAPTVPEEAGDGRLTGAVLVDAVLTVLLALNLAQRVDAATAGDGIGVFWLSFAAGGLALSFVNHVLGTRLLGGSAGKLLWGLRVIRWRDGRRPRFRQATGRWLAGFGILIAQVVLEGETVGQACGLRTVRRRDLRARR